MPKLIIFDVDGTLLDDGFRQLLIESGKENEAKRIQKAYEKRRIKGPWVRGFKLYAEGLRGIKEKDLRRIANQIVKRYLIPGAKEVLGKLKAEDWLIGAYSSTPLIIVDEIERITGIEFDDKLVNELEFKNGVCTGKLARSPITRYEKGERLKVYMKKLGLESCWVVGDSITDLPMAKVAGKFIAFRPKDGEVKRYANYVIEDITEIMDLIGAR